MVVAAARERVYTETRMSSYCFFFMSVESNIIFIFMNEFHSPCRHRCARPLTFASSHIVPECMFALWRRYSCIGAHETSDTRVNKITLQVPIYLKQASVAALEDDNYERC